MRLQASILKILATGLLVLACHRSLMAQVYFIDGRRKAFSFPFQFVHNLVIIKACINNSEPFLFLLDTGVGINIITDKTLANQLGLAFTRSIRISGFGDGKELTAKVTSETPVTVHNKIKGRLAFAVLEDDLFNLSAFTGLPVKGILGAGFFESFIVGISYARNRIRVHAPGSHIDAAKKTLIPLIVRQGKPYLRAQVQHVSGDVDSITLIIDTGAGHPLSLETLHDRTYPLPPKNINALLGVGLSGNIQGHLARLPVLKLGNFSFREVLTAFPDSQQTLSHLANFPRNGNLGNGILKRFNVTFDYGRQLMYLQKNGRYNQPFEHDMSGMELIWAGDDYHALLIARIEDNAAAAEAGLQVSDQILDINLRPVKDYDHEELYAIFQSGHNRALVLRVARTGEPFPLMFMLRLKKRI